MYCSTTTAVDLYLVVSETSLASKASSNVHTTEEGALVLRQTLRLSAPFGRLRRVAFLHQLFLDELMISLVNDVIDGVALRHHVYLDKGGKGIWVGQVASHLLCMTLIDNRNNIGAMRGRVSYRSDDLTRFAKHCAYRSR